MSNLTSSATLSFTLGTEQVIACASGTTPPCVASSYNITDIVGSYFAMDFNVDGIVDPNEKNGISSFNGIHLGSIQLADGSHNDAIDGTELPNIDNPWTMLGATGMHQTISAINVANPGADYTSAQAIDFSGWEINWNGIILPLVETGVPTIICDTFSCSDSSNYTIDADFHMSGSGFTTASYFLHLEGQVSTAAVPVPATAWLFGSGLLGLIGVARRRKTA